MKPQEWLKNKQQILRTKRLGDLIEQAFQMERQILLQMEESEVYDYMISKLNFCQRKNAYSYRELLKYRIKVGDICFIDFGQAYQMEIGYLHFGLILAFKHQKAFVIPMTGKKGDHKEHQFDLGRVPGLYKESCLFLNDAKWINTSRIIDVKGHIDVHSHQFQTILKSVGQCIGLACHE